MSRDYVKTRVDQLQGSYPQVINGNLAANGTTQVNHDDVIDYLGEVPPSDQFRNPSKTNVYPSPFHSKLRWPTVTKPANLGKFEGKDGEIIDPLRLAIEKQFSPTKQFDQEILGNATKDFKDMVLSMKSPYKERPNKILSEYENLNGIDGDDYICSMNMKTSPGYPFTKHPLFYSDKRKNKYGFLKEVSEDKFMLKTSIKDVILEKEIAMSQGIVPPFIWTDNMKDERLPANKVDRGKVRVFNCGPLDLTYLTRKYFLTFIAHCMHNNTGEISCGINAHSISWMSLYKRITKYGKHKVIAGDYSNYDKRLPFDVIMQILDVIQEFYDDEHYMIRKSIFIATFNAIHLCGKSLYRCFRGNPSGTPLTTIINCCANAILFRYAYMYLSVRQEPSVDPFTFRMYVEFASFGDDNISGVSDKVPWFNAIAYSKVMEEYGIAYTSSAKENVVVEYEHIDDVSYLKRSFVFRDSWMFAPLDKNSIHETMQWCRMSNTHIDEIMQATFNSFCQEMVHYGEEEFNDYVDHVMSVACRLPEPVVLMRSEFHTLLKNMISQSF
jgi:hypothetical protein